MDARFMDFFPRKHVASIDTTAPSADWRSAVAPFIGANGWRASLQLLTTLVPLVALVSAVHVVHEWSATLAMVLTLPTAAFLVRTFVLMHDCAHGSLFASHALNNVVGFATGVLT